MKCLNRPANIIGAFIILICCIINGSDNQSVHAQSSTYNLTTSYIVQYGDTLSAIAARYGISLQEIATTNNIGNINNIRIGQVLIIPSRSGSTNPPALELSQPLVAPAQPAPSAPQPLPDPQPQPQSQPRRLGAPAEISQPLVANQPNMVPQARIDSEAEGLSAIPDQSSRQVTNPAPIQPASAPAVGCAVNPGANERAHSVRPGDTLYGIARTYGATVTAVRQRNSLTSDRIRVGECLIVPAGTTVTPVPDRRRSSEQPAATDTPTLVPTPNRPVYTTQSQG